MLYWKTQLKMSVEGVRKIKRKQTDNLSKVMLKK